MVKGLKEHDGPITAKGYDMFEVLAALQKEIRRGKEYEAVYWALELERSKLKPLPKALWNRLRVIASEDVGLADPLASLIVDVLEKQYYADKKNSRLFLVHAVLCLARSPKSRMVDNLLAVVYNDERKLEIPDYALDMHTYSGRKMGRGYDHFFTEGAKLKNQAFEDPYENAAFEALKKKKKT